MFSFFKKIKESMLRTYENYIVIPKVNDSLKVLTDIIQVDDKDGSRDRLNKSNKLKIIASSKVLRKYPDILERQGLGYLKSFVSKDYNEAIKIGEHQTATRLSQAIAMAIPEKDRDDMMNGNTKFESLAKSQDKVTSSLALNLTIIHKYVNGDEASKAGADRAKKEVITKLTKQGMSDNRAKRFSEELLEVAPLVYASYASKIDVVKRNDISFVIVAPKEGVDIEKYREGVKTTNDIHAVVDAMAKKDSLDKDTLKLLNERADKIIKNDKFAKESLVAFDSKKQKISVLLTDISPPDKTPAVSKKSSSHTR